MLFWGCMTGHLLIGLLLAIVVEAPRWVRVEWEFNDEACTRAWQFTCIAIGLAAALIWLDGSRYEALPVLLGWLPPLLMPMQFVQSFGRRDALPLNTFSFLARQRRERNRRLGLADSIHHIHFGNILFVTAIVSAAMGSFASANPSLFLMGVIVLSGWIFRVKNRGGMLTLLIAFSIVTCIAVAGQMMMSRAYEWAANFSGVAEKKFDPNSTETMVGKPGKVEQSPEIIWRLTAEKGVPVPRLLRLASYGIYENGTWSNERVSAVDFKDLITSEPVKGEAYYLLNDVSDAKAISPTLPRYTLRGAAAAETPLPLPGSAASLRDFALDGIERNSLGSVRIFPKAPVIEGVVLWNGETNPETPPLDKEDLNIPPREVITLSKTAKEIGLLDEPDFDEKLGLLRSWFFQNFSYSRELKISSSSAVVSRPSGIQQFLTKQREGHCEYFATACALLLREAGIPSRYTTGYVVHERDVKHQEMVIRGTHGHAWCRAWNESSQRWVDLDPTPPQWLPSATPELTAMQRVQDALKRLREDFFLWRNRPGNRLASSLVMGLIALGIAGFVGKRLWKSMQRQERLNAFYHAGGPLIRTPLHDLEPQARKLLGYRPAGQTFAVWLQRLGPDAVETALLDDAISIHQRLRFDPAAELPEDRARLVEISYQLGRALRKG